MGRAGLEGTNARGVIGDAWNPVSGLAQLCIGALFLFGLLVPSSLTAETSEETLLKHRMVLDTIDTTHTKSDPGPGIPYAVDVNRFGAAVVDVPLAIPSGRGGLEPVLGLSYNSHVGDGPLGMGWSVSGTPMITRCSRSQARDGLTKAVSFDAGDAFCLDGVRLRPVTTYSTSEATVYFKEDGSADKIVGIGPGPDLFRVFSTDGNVYDFGALEGTQVSKSLLADAKPVLIPRDPKEASALVAETGGSIRTWALSRISDRSGNYVTFNYRRSFQSPSGVEELSPFAFSGSATSEFVPVEIKYSGNGTLVPHTIVRFEYEARPDPFSGYFAGTVVQRNLRMSAIRIEAADGDLISEYKLEYAADNALVQNEIYGSRLSSITLCDDRSTCHQPLKFKWSTPQLPSPYSMDSNVQAPFAGASGIFGAGSIAEDPKHSFDPAWNPAAVDANCDGTTDLVYPRDGTWWAIDGRVQPEELKKERKLGGSFVTHNNTGYFVSAWPLDYDADGCGDALIVDNSASLQLLKGSENGVEQIDTGLKYGLGAVWKRRDLSIIDVNGDLYPDLVLIDDQERKWKFAINRKGAGFDLYPVDQAIVSNGLASKFSLDCDGDSYPELFATLSGFSQPLTVYKLGQNGELFQEIETDIRVERNLRIVDLNGDGLDDLLTGSTNNNRMYARFSKGDCTFTPETDVQVDVGDLAPIDWRDSNLGRSSVADVDGNQLSDVLIPVRYDNGIYWSIMKSVGGINKDGTPVARFKLEKLETPVGTGTEGRNPAYSRAILVDVQGNNQAVLAHVTEDRFFFNLLRYSRRPSPDRPRVVEAGNVKLEYSWPSDPNVYTRAPSAFGKTDVSDAITTTPKQMVVRALTRERSGTVTYHYRSALFGRRGEGWLGFHEILQSRDLYYHSEFTYRQFDLLWKPGEATAPCLGRVQREAVVRSSGGSISDNEIGDHQNGSSIVHREWQYAPIKRPSDLPPTCSLLSMQEQAAVSLEPSTLDQALQFVTEVATRNSTALRSTIKIEQSDFTEMGLPTKSVTIISDSRSIRRRHTVNLVYEPLTGLSGIDPWFGQRVVEIEGIQTVDGNSTSRQTKIEYDSATGRIQGVRVDGGQKGSIATYGHDKFGNVVSLRYEAKGSTLIEGTCASAVDGSHVYRTFYDKDGRFPVGVIGPAGELTGLLYGEKQGTLLGIVQPDGVITRYWYDGFARPTASQVGNAPKQTLTYDVAPLGYFANAPRWSVRIDRPGSPSRIVFYDSDSIPDTVLVSRLGGDWAIQSTHIFPDDVLRSFSAGWRLANDPLSEPGDWDTNLDFEVVDYYHDFLDRLTDTEGSESHYLRYGLFDVSTTHPTGRETKTTVDESDYVTRIDFGEGNVRPGASKSGIDSFLFVYSPDGQLARVTGPKNFIAEITFDDLGHEESVLLPSGGSANFTVDALGQILETVSPDGTTRMAYDPSGRMTCKEDRSGTSSWTYGKSGSESGHLVKSTSPDRVNKILAYDGEGRLSSLTVALDQEAMEVGLSYDSESRISNVSFPKPLSGEKVSLGYSYTDGYLTGVHLGQKRIWHLETMDFLGRVHSVELGNGLSEHTLFDNEQTVGPTGRQLQDSKGALLFDQALTFEYGPLVKLDEERIRARSSQFEYDYLDRLSREVSCDTQTTNCDSKGVSYDGLGNILHKFGVGEFVYSSAVPTRLVSVDNAPIGYDVAGNISSYRGLDFSFTPSGSLKTVVAGGDTWQAFYTAEQERVKFEGSSEVAYEMPGTFERKYYSASGGNWTKARDIFYLSTDDAPPFAALVREYDMEPVSATWVISSERLIYLHRDAFGSVVAQTDQVGLLVQKVRFDAWGGIIEVEDGQGAKEWTSPVLLGYRGMPHKLAIDRSWIDMGARVYFSDIGRFLSPDPLITISLNGQDDNPFAYARNNPVVFSDRSGLFAGFDGGDAFGTVSTSIGVPGGSFDGGPVDFSSADLISSALGESGLSAPGGGIPQAVGPASVNGGAAMSADSYNLRGRAPIVTDLTNGMSPLEVLILDNPRLDSALSGVYEFSYGYSTGVTFNWGFGSLEGAARWARGGHTPSASSSLVRAGEVASVLESGIVLGLGVGLRIVAASAKPLTTKALARGWDGPFGRLVKGLNKNQTLRIGGGPNSVGRYIPRVALDKRHLPELLRKSPEGTLMNKGGEWLRHIDLYNELLPLEYSIWLHRDSMFGDDN